MYVWVPPVNPTILLFLMVVFLVLACASWGQPRTVFALARWNGFVSDPDETPEGFYSRLFTELKARLEENQMPFTSIGFGPKHLFSKRVVFGPRPVYLVLKYREFTYYVYAVPAPGGVFVTAWLFSRYVLWEEHPVLKWVLAWRLYQQTLFQFDVMDLFHFVAHSTLIDVINSYREEQGLGPLDDYESRPILQSYFARLKQGPLPQNPYASPVISAQPVPAPSQPDWRGPL